MSDTRYSPGHTVLHAGVFILPYLPLRLVATVHGDSPYPDTYFQFGIIWMTGLAINLGLIVVHELAHFFAARAVGIEIAEIVIGHWRRLISRKIGPTQVTFRAAPDSGYVVVKPSDRLLSGPRMTVFLLAGVATEAAIVAAVAGFWHALPAGPRSFGEFFTAYWQMGILCFGSLHVVFNLLPHDGMVGGATLPTDGKQLWQFWRSRHGRPALRKLLCDAQQLDALLKEKRFPDALPLIAALAAQHPENLEIQKLHGTVLAENGKIDEALAIWQKLLERSGLSKSQLAGLLDTVSCVSIYYGRDDLLPRADAWTNEALRYAPSAITLKGTRGSVLVELGRIDEGSALLRDVVKHSECPLDQAIGLANLAKIAMKTGNHNEAAEFLTKAQRIDAENRVVKRITAELSTSTNSAQSPRP